MTASIVPGESRRGVFVPHAHDRAKLERCPVCRWAVEQDHEEALAIHTQGARAKLPLRPATPSGPTAGREREPVADVDFALV
jgi:hypothetical protein